MGKSLRLGRVSDQEELQILSLLLEILHVIYRQEESEAHMLKNTMLKGVLMSNIESFVGSDAMLEVSQYVCSEVGFDNGANMNFTNNGLSVNPPNNLSLISLPIVADNNDHIPAHNVFIPNGFDANYHSFDNMCHSSWCESRYLGAVAANKELCVLIGELRRREVLNDSYCCEIQSMVLSRNNKISSYMNEIDQLRSEQRALMNEVRVMDEELAQVRREFVMSNLPDDAIGIYHWMFDFSGVRIPFSSFLLALIKHYRVHFSQLALGLNKGDWFSFAKRRAPSPVCIDDNRSSIDDPQPVAGSFSMADIRRLSAHVIKLRDMPEGVLVLSGLSLMGIHDFLCLPEWTSVEVQEEPHHDIRLTLQRLPFYYTPPAVIDAVTLDPIPEDLAMDAKIIAKKRNLSRSDKQAFQKRKASTSGATSSHVAKRIRFAFAQSSGSTTCPGPFMDNSDNESDDDDACVEIPLVTPIRSTVVIPSLGNQGGSSAALPKDSQGKGIMVDDVAAPSVGAGQPRPSFGPASSFRDVSRDAIHTDFLSFSAGPYYATYPEGGVTGNCEFTREE
ncbi:hypothetical protein Tco_0899220 [Tanacetum coccineum]